MFINSVISFIFQGNTFTEEHIPTQFMDGASIEYFYIEIVN